MSLTTLSLTLCYLFIYSSYLEFGIWIFSSHVVAYIVIFDSRFETRKSDIIRPRYELFNACGGSCPSLPCLWHYLTISFTPLSSSFGIGIFSSHVVAYIVSFGSSSWTWKYDIIRPRYWFKLLKSKFRYHTAVVWAFQCMWWLMSLTM